jgi:hypothetical protein
MSKDRPTVKMARPGEPEAARTTIVGGRPPGAGVIPRHIPRGLEVLIKKAAVDPAFKDILFEKRAGAAEAIGLKLTAAEEAMLAAVPLSQLEGIVAHTRISPKLKPVFLGYAAGAMLAAIGTAGYAVDCTRFEKLPDTSVPRRWKGDPPTYRVRAAPPLDAPSGDLDAIFAELSGIPYYSGRGLPGEPPPSPRSYGGLGIRPDYPGGISARSRIKKRGNVYHNGPSSISGEGAASSLRSPKTISRIVRQRLAGIEYLHKKALRNGPGLSSGKITVRFVIAADGEILSASAVTDTIGNPALTRDVLSRIMTWRFPPIDAGDVTVVYPFIFVNAGT